MLAYTIGPTELIIILAIVLLLFGAKRLPEVFRAMGRSTSEFKRGVSEGGAEAEQESSRPEPAGDRPAEKPAD